MAGWGLASLLLTGRAAAQPVPTINKAHALVMYRIGMRIAPSFEPESQINLTAFKDQTTTGELIVADRNIYYRSNELLKAGVANEAETLGAKNSAKHLERPPIAPR